MLIDCLLKVAAIGTIIKIIYKYFKNKLVFKDFVTDIMIQILQVGVFIKWRMKLVQDSKANNKKETNND